MRMLKNLQRILKNNVTKCIKKKAAAVLDALAAFNKKMHVQVRMLHHFITFHSHKSFDEIPKYLF